MWRVRVRRGPWWCGWWWTVAVAAAAALALSGRGVALALSPPRCPSELALRDRCQPGRFALDEYNFNINKIRLQYKYTDSGYFSLSCPTGVTLDEPALPRFDIELRVNRVEFACPLPAASYSAVLRALNVSAPDKLTLIGHELRGERLAGLPRLRTLVLDSVEFDPSARDLRHLTGLRRLRLDGTAFTAADLERLPAGLQLLQLVRTTVGLVPAAALARLPDLAALLVVDEVSVRAEAAGAEGLRLGALTVESDEGADVSLALPRGLVNLTVRGWGVVLPPPWEACSELATLELVEARAEALPDGWVARCPALATLVVRGARLARLAAGALRGATALRRVSLARCALEALPAGLLHDAPELIELDLSDNRLLELPGGLFERSRRLSELLLSRNRLTGAALDSLAAVTSLTTLTLHGNAALDACPADHHADYVFQQRWSKLRDLKSLGELNLSYTSTSQVCEDWRQMPRLRQLALAHTAVTRLERGDLRFNSAVDVTVTLTGANVTTLSFEPRDLLESADGRARAVRVQLSEPLRCDCDLYWAAAALRRRPDTDTRLRVEGARCADGRELRNVSLDELVCRTPAGTPCPEGCACSVRPDESPPERVLRLDCERAGLSRVPSANRTLAALAALAAPNLAPYALDLRLAHNTIDALGPADLPPELASLDLRNNSLSVIDEAAARALVSRPDRRVWLAGNPLECGCRAAAALAAVRSAPDVFADRTAAACVGGAPLAAASLDPPQPCRTLGGGWRAGGAAAAAALAMVAAALVLALLRPELRLRAKAALRMWGLMPRARESDDGRVYDAFVSFAHADVTVVREMVSRLESGATPLRLCVHYRDWMPGGWIPTQIAASVRVSRRTVAVVSAAFLRSEWARAEFREAYAAALRDAEPRLVVVLLEDPARLPLDAELRAYLAANTYVRWDDPWFWPKLRRALPAPAPRREKRDAPSTDGSASASVSSALTVSADDASVKSAATASTDASIRSTETTSYPDPA